MKNKTNKFSEEAVEETVDTEEKTCANCSMPQDQWSRGGKGYKTEEEVYCCKGCAQDIGCTCNEE